MDAIAAAACDHANKVVSLLRSLAGKDQHGNNHNNGSRANRSGGFAGVILRRAGGGDEASDSDDFM